MTSGIAKPRKHHQINMTTGRLAPFTELRRQGLVLLGKSLGLEILQSLVHQIEGVVDQLGGLFGGHGTAGDGWLIGRGGVVVVPFWPGCNTRHEGRSLCADPHQPAAPVGRSHC